MDRGTRHDFVIVSAREDGARWAMSVLPKRFGKYGLTLDPDRPPPGVQREVSIRFRVSGPERPGEVTRSPAFWNPKESRRYRWERTYLQGPR
jgi:hypothetical protein